MRRIAWTAAGLLIGFGYIWCSRYLRDFSDFQVSAYVCAAFWSGACFASLYHILAEPSWHARR